MTLSSWISQKLFPSSENRIDIKDSLCIDIHKRIKLSVITQFFPPDYAATGQLVEELVRNLSQQGIEIEVFTGQPGYAYRAKQAPTLEQWDRLKIQRSRASGIWPGRIRGKAVNGVLFAARAMLHVLKNCRNSNLLLLTTAPPFLPLIGYIGHLLLRKPYICILYDLYPDIAIALGVVPQDNWLAKFWKSVNKRIWEHAEAMIVLSPEMKFQVVSYCPQIAHKVFVIPSWGNPQTIVPIPKQKNWFAWKYNLTNKFTVLYSGNMGRCHDMETILEAVKILQDEPIQFVFIGGGAKKEELKRAVKSHSLDNCIFLPYQEKEILPYSLTACDLSLVSVDKGMENLVAPSKLYPALATGRPVAIVCSQTSFLRELIEDANCGKTFVNGDSNGLADFIRYLSQDSQFAQKLGRASRHYLRSHFTPEIISREYLNVLEKIRC